LKDVRVPGFLHHIEALVSAYGIPALFVSVAFEALGAPLPGESAIILASGAASRGEFSIYTVAITAFLAAVLGDNVAYVIGRKLGRPAILRFGGRIGVTDAALAKTEAVARRYGPLMVVFARFVVVLRLMNGLVAGTTGMNWLTFLLSNRLGASLWAGFWSTLEFRFGCSTDILPFFWHHLNLVAAVGILLIIAGLVWLQFWHRGSAKAP
jgi:membrane protein DedA with SNARE-associated domain